MEKDQPPPYSAEGIYPQPGFNAPPNQAPPDQGYQLPQQQGYAPPQQPYPSVPPIHTQPGPTTVVVTSMPIAQFGPVPQPMVCPHCHKQITSRLDVEPSGRTHIFALVLCLIGCIPCCLIPYCMDSCQNRNHYCPNCNAFLGSYIDGDLGRRGYY